MKVLAIDSSSMVATVAVATEDILIGEYTINHKKTHSQTLMPMIEQMLGMAEISVDEIDAIAVAGGPGSFTGLRIGSATAKGLGLALNIPIINVPTMDAMAYVLYNIQGVICPIMDARREQVYTGMYKFIEGKLSVEKEQEPMDIHELIRELNLIGEKVTFIGDGISSYNKIIQDEMKVPYEFAAVHMNRQRAGALAALAIQYYKEGKIESADVHKPEYMRMSQAERERKEKEMSDK